MSTTKKASFRTLRLKTATVIALIFSVLFVVLKNRNPRETVQKLAGAMEHAVAPMSADQVRLAREQELAAEFEQSVGPAGKEYAEQVRAAFSALEAQLSDGFKEIVEEFATACVDADGITERIKGEDDAKRMLSATLRGSISDLVSRCLQDFRASVEEAQQLLEMRLLVSASPDSKLAQEIRSCGDKTHRYAPTPPVADLRGRGWAKTFDEGFAWIPIAGDIYDGGKLIFGDPRENGIRARARAFVHGEESKFLVNISEIKNALPDAAVTERLCRAGFKPKAALALLDAQSK